MAGLSEEPGRSAYVGGIYAPAPLALVFGLTQIQALVVLFILLPIGLAGVLVPLLVRWMSKGPKPILTSDLLAHGTLAEGEVLRVRNVGNLLDPRPMVRFKLRVTAAAADEPFELEVVQSVPRSLVSSFRPGDLVRVRLSEDRSAGAIEWGYEAPDA